MFLFCTFTRESESENICEKCGINIFTYCMELYFCRIININLHNLFWYAWNFIIILHSLICRVLLLLLLLLLLLRNASDLRNCTSYFGACMWVWYCRPPIGANFHPNPQPPPVPQQLGEKDGSPLRGVARLCRGWRPPLGDRTRLVIIKFLRRKLDTSNRRCFNMSWEFLGGTVMSNDELLQCAEKLRIS